MKMKFKNPLKINEGDGLAKIILKSAAETYLVGLVSTGGLILALATVGLLTKGNSKK